MKFVLYFNSSSKSVDLPAVPPAPAKQRATTLAEFPSTLSNNNSGISTLGGATNRALEED
ncbi:uncharacterized protein LOC135436640 isoform X1 [Drosophila montana]|uniref:uncharacterized protein LOC135436640 isoform X1 n=1 Tax=Drosophila montana TaxID=40370 RepID=UPI00313BFD5A